MSPFDQILLGMILMVLWEARDRHMEGPLLRWTTFALGIAMMTIGLYRFGMEML